MAKQGRKKKKTHSKAAVAVATVLSVILLAGIGIGVFHIAVRLRDERAASAAGVQNFEADIPRNTYLADGFSSTDGRLAYEDDLWTSETGIDVSVHQGTIDWAAVAGDGIQYAVIQAGYRGYSDGDLGEDEQFAANLSGSAAAGVKRGVYFFSQASSEEEARREADFVLKLLNGAALELPVFFDWERVESDTARSGDVAGETVTACARAFCEEITAAGYEAGVYFSQNDVYTLVDLSQLLEYPLWMAEYQSEPDFFYDFAYWQYTDSGTVAGINAPVDMNLRFVQKETAAN
ncbi:MAG: glycoside hydrolase family 25 protein [Oscillospiraceae bacterium]|nr:glycoside hydrolase family 25 protein [Oscillospiraceae bacterium]